MVANLEKSNNFEINEMRITVSHHSENSCGRLFTRLTPELPNARKTGGVRPLLCRGFLVKAFVVIFGCFEGIRDLFLEAKNRSCKNLGNLKFCL
jgi:hypothetical protein